MEEPEWWSRLNADPQAIGELLRPLARTDSSRAMCDELAGRARRAAVRTKNGGSKSLIVLFADSPKLPGWYPMMEWDPPRDAPSEVQFDLPDDYVLFSTLTNLVVLDYAKEIPDGDLDKGVATYGTMEMLFGTDAAAGSTEDMLGEDYLGQVLADPSAFGWTQEHLILNRPDDVFAIGDDCNSNFYVLHREVHNREKEPAVLPWFHDEPGGYEQAMLSSAARQTGCGDWLICKLNCFVLHDDFFERIRA